MKELSSKAHHEHYYLISCMCYDVWTPVVWYGLWRIISIFQADIQTCFVSLESTARWDVYTFHIEMLCCACSYYEWKKKVVHPEMSFIAELVIRCYSSDKMITVWWTCRIIFPLSRQQIGLPDLQIDSVRLKDKICWQKFSHTLLMLDFCQIHFYINIVLPSLANKQEMS